MRIGVDFGTTRVVVAAADRGNYPLVHFETPDGQMRDWFPPIVAARGGAPLRLGSGRCAGAGELDIGALVETRIAHGRSANGNSFGRRIRAFAGADGRDDDGFA